MAMRGQTSLPDVDREETTMIQTIASFISYFESVRRRTLRYIRVIPPEQLEWAPKPGEFTCGDIVRHIGAAEAMFVGVVVDGRWHYAGHASETPVELSEAIRSLDDSHSVAMQRLGEVPDDVLFQLRPSLDGPPIAAWRWQMAMVEHEVHHRSQLAVYLTLLDVTPPHIFGLGVEDVIARATG
jgi:uncharacterized damage-inducible protein DinB